MLSDLSSYSHLHDYSTQGTYSKAKSVSRLRQQLEQLLERRSVGMEEPCKRRPSGIYMEHEWKRKNGNPRLKDRPAKKQISDGERNHAHVHFVEYSDVRRTSDIA